MYTLAEVANPVTGWGLDGESWQMLDMLRRYGEDAWFGLGDRDVATHLLRTTWLREGVTLTEATARLSQALGVACRLLPVTDDWLATMVDTVEQGTLAFQEYFVRERWQPTVRRIWFRHGVQLRITSQVQAALREADVIVICPSNPYLSIAPILAVPGLREHLRAAGVPIVAVSPLVGGAAVKGPTAKIMAELGIPVAADEIAHHYGELLDGFVLDVRDAALRARIARPVHVTDTLMLTPVDRVRVARETLDFARRLRTPR